MKWIDIRRCDHLYYHRRFLSILFSLHPSILLLDDLNHSFQQRQQVDPFKIGHPISFRPPCLSILESFCTD